MESKFKYLGDLGLGSPNGVPKLVGVLMVYILNLVQNLMEKAVELSMCVVANYVVVEFF